MASVVGALRILAELDASGVQSGIAQVSTAMQSAGDKLSAIGGTMTKWITGPIAGAGTALFALGDKFAQATATIRVGTGATGDALAGLESDFKAVLANVPADMGTVASAIADLNTRTGLAGDGLRAMATQMLELGRITGEDVSTLIVKATRSFGDWGVAVEDQAQVLDKLFVVSQSTGIGMSDLLEKIVQFGAPTRNVGFTLGEFATMLGKWEKEGVNTTLVLGSMRIALNRTAEAVADLDGNQIKVALATEKYQEAIAKHGAESAKAADAAIKLRDAQAELDFSIRASTTDFEGLIRSIQDAPDAMTAISAATELFGAKAGPDMAAAIREGRFEIGELVAQIKESTETIHSASEDSKTFGDRMSEIGNKLAVAFEPLATTVLDAINANLPAIEQLVGKISEAVQWFAKLEPGTQGWIAKLILLAGIAGPAALFVGQLLSGLSGLVAAAPKIVGGIVAVSKAFVPAALAIAPYVAAVLAIGVAWTLTWDIVRDANDDIIAEDESFWSVLMRTADAWGSWFKKLPSEIWAEVTFTFESAWRTISDGWTSFWDAITETASGWWSAFKGFFVGIWESAKSIVVGAWEGIVAAVKGGINSAISAINLFTSFLSSLVIQVPVIEIPFVGTVGGFTVGMPAIPQIPLLAEGGVVTRPTLAVVGESGPEAIVPLSSLAPAGAGGSVINVNVTLTGSVWTTRELTRAIRDELERGVRRDGF